MSLIQSFKTEADGMIIVFADKNKVKIPIQSEGEARIKSDKLCRCYDISKEYYNPSKIILKKNVDRIVWLYDTHK